MTVYAVGDSIAVGLATQGGADIYQENGRNPFATSGVAVRNMGRHFARLTERVQPGDQVIISGGYNGGLDRAGALLLTQWINALQRRGTEDSPVTVTVLGLREAGLSGGLYAGLAGQTVITNNMLREIARETGAVFSEGSIGIANQIANGEIHGNYPQLAQSALAALRGTSPAAGVQTAGVAPPIGSTGRGRRGANGEEDTTAPQPVAQRSGSASSPDSNGFAALFASLQEMLAQLFQPIIEALSRLDPTSATAASSPAPAGTAGAPAASTSAAPAPATPPLASLAPQSGAYAVADALHVGAPGGPASTSARSRS